MCALCHVLTDEIPKGSQILRSTAREEILSWHKLDKVQRLCVDFSVFLQLVARLVHEPWQELFLVELANELVVEKQLKKDTRRAIEHVSGATRAGKLLKMTYNRLSTNINFNISNSYHPKHRRHASIELESTRRHNVVLKHDRSEQLPEQRPRARVHDHSSCRLLVKLFLHDASEQLANTRAIVQVVGECVSV